MAATSVMAPPAAAGVPEFWRNLNVFTIAFVVVAAVGIWMLVIPVSLALKLFPASRQAEAMAFPLAYALLAALLGGWWWKFGLSPRVRRPDRERRFRWGHVLLAICNVLALGGLAASYLLPSLLTHTKLPAMPAVSALILMVYPLIPVAGIAGLIMVLGSRAAPVSGPDARETTSDAAAFADTVIEGPAAIARWPAPPKAPSPKNRGGAAVGIFFGMAASGLVIFMGLVFASLGFQGRPEVFTAWVLPIAAACGVLWVTVVLWLYGKERHQPAAALAWTPVMLIVALPALQMVVFAVRELVGK